jgi:hypothetical protein
VPGHAVRFAGLGHALAGGGLPRLVLSHDHFFPGGSARVCPPWMNGMTKARHVNDVTDDAPESWTLVLVAGAGAGRPLARKRAGGALPLKAAYPAASRTAMKETRPFGRGKTRPASDAPGGRGP